MMDKMAPSGAFFTFIATIFIFLLLPSKFSVANTVESDVDCLKSIKDSLEDPLNRLKTWNFSTNVEGFVCVFVGVTCWHAYDNRVFMINLSGMGLRGQFPPGLENCTGLSSLNLSSNELSGPIPIDIGQKLKFVTVLDLSSNHFSGIIPPTIASCRYLAILILNNNSLTGKIPSELGFMDRIQDFNMANNKLTGPVPNFVKATSVYLNYENNPGLCGYPLKGCKGTSNSDQEIRTFFISGFMTGCAISTVLVLLACAFAVRRVTFENILAKKKKGKENVDGRSQHPKDINNTETIAKLEKYITRISFLELANGTANFSQENIIGIGKTGMMYKATLSNGWALAIKRILDSELLQKQIVSELMILGRLRHRRLEPLTAFCFENKGTLLVYKYMSSGNLYDRLHNQNDEGKIIAWPLRVKIALGIAEGLAWIHNFCSPKTVHSSISSKCILLDENFEPKISNFWEAKLLRLTDSVWSWSFFPRSDSSELDSDKKDVYSFGILLLEILTGKDPEELAVFVDNFGDSPLIGSSSAPFEADETLIGGAVRDEIIQFIEIAKSCVNCYPDQRPTMLEVYRILAAFTQIYNYTIDYEIVL